LATQGSSWTAAAGRQQQQLDRFHAWQQLDRFHTQLELNVNVTQTRRDDTQQPVALQWWVLALCTSGGVSGGPKQSMHWYPA